MAITKFSDTNFSPLFKKLYGDYCDNLSSSGAEDVLYAAIAKDYDKLRGEQLEFPIKTGYGGSVGFGTLPTANTAKYEKVILTRKRAYARLNLDRETMKASKGKDAAFKEATQAEVDAKMKSFMRMQACALYNDGTGILGQFSVTPTGTAAAPVVVILDTAANAYKFRSAFFEEGDYVNVYSAAAAAVLPSVFEIISVVNSTFTVTLSRISGSDDLTAIAAGTHSLVLANSYNAAPMGVKGAVEFTSGSFENIAFGRKWSPTPLDAAVNSVPTPISADHFTKISSDIEVKSSEYPDLFILSPELYVRLSNRLGDSKVFVDILSNSTGSGKVRMSFKAIELEGPGGPIKIARSKYVNADRFYALNTDKENMCQYYLGKPEWFEDDGKMLLRIDGVDGYEARYGTYQQNYFNPTRLGYAFNLSRT